MSFIVDDIRLNQELKNKVIASAASSLTAFAVKFEDGTGLLCEAGGNLENPLIETRLMSADELPTIGDAVCKVEWAWIVSSRIESLSTVAGSLKLNLVPAGELTITAQLWKGSLFLSFMPYKGS